MEPNARFRRNVLTVYAWIGSMAVLLVTPILALRLIDRETTFARAAAVVLGMGGMLPWMWVVFSIIQRGDEFTRRVHLIALGLAFGATLVLLAALHWLERAGFLSPPDLLVVLAGCLVLWFVALTGTKRYFERSH